MKRRRLLYIAISILIIGLIIGLLGWAIFIGRQQQELQQGAKDLGYFGGTPGRETGGGLFGGVSGGDGEGERAETTKLEPGLRQLYNLPIAGYVETGANAVRFVDRATGHIFEKNLADGTTTRIDQTTVPQVYRAVFNNNGDGVVRQYIDESMNVVSVYNNIAKKGQGVSLPTNTPEIVANPGSELLTVLQDTPEGSLLSLIGPDGNVEKNLFSSGIRGWNIDQKGDYILMTQKPSGTLPGSSYLINASSGEQSLALKQIPGLVANVRPDGRAVVYSETNREGLPVLYVRYLENNEVVPLNVATFADKCAWHPTEPTVYCALPNGFPDAMYPDAWYQGAIRFVDSVWKIDTQTALATLIVSPTTNYGLSLDIIEMRISVDEAEIFFKNKTDQTLWSISFPDTPDEEDREVGGGAG
jgi:hypothetical protein